MAVISLKLPGWDGDDLRHIANESLQFTPPQQTALRMKASTCCLTATHANPEP